MGRHQHKHRHQHQSLRSRSTALEYAVCGPPCELVTKPVVHTYSCGLCKLHFTLAELYCCIECGSYCCRTCAPACSSCDRATCNDCIKTHYRFCQFDQGMLGHNKSSTEDLFNGDDYRREHRVQVDV